MTTPCPDCPPSELAAKGDDDRTLRMLRDLAIPALKPQKFVVTIEVAACGPYHTVKSLLDQYRSILNVPLTERMQEDIEEELRDFASTLENLPHLIYADIQQMFEADEPFMPSTLEARMLGIDIDHTTTVTDE